MNSINKKIAVSVLASFLLITTQASLAEMRELNKDEIIAAFSGKTAWGHHEWKDKRTKVYFAPDGTFKGKRLDERGGGAGKWSVNDKNQLCMEKNDNSKCRRVVDKNGKLKRYKGDKLVWNFTKFKDGNQL